jgi:RNA polymerase sigma-70 factor (ECF subfamily)
MDQSNKRRFQNWEIAVAKNLVNAFQAQWLCLEREDFADLLQECLTHWFITRDSYEPTREASEKTFMAKVVRNKLTDLVREREADKRKIAHLAVSLDAPLGSGEDSHSLIDEIKEGKTGNVPGDPFLEIQLKIDLSTVLHKLTPKQKKLCDLLGAKGLNVKKASEYLETPRATIYDEIKRIKKIFEKEGLKDYLK